MIAKIGNTGLVSSGFGDNIFVDVGITTLSTSTTSSNATFTGGQSLKTVTNYGANDTFNFVQGNLTFTDYGTGTRLTLGAGNATINETKGGAVISVGAGTQTVVLRGDGNSLWIGDTTAGTASSITSYGNANFIAARNGNVTLEEKGANDTVWLGDGSDIVNIGRGHAGPTSDIVHLGNGAKNTISVYAGGNTIYGGTGMTFLNENTTGTGVGNTVVANAAGGSIVFGAGFTLGKGDHLDLTQILMGRGGVTSANAASFIDDMLSGANTVLTIHGLGGTVTATLNGVGAVPLSALISSHFLVLPGA